MTRSLCIVCTEERPGNKATLSSATLLSVQVPGEYFLKPLLREFEFTPSSTVSVYIVYVGVGVGVLCIRVHLCLHCMYTHVLN